jgi:hypothetical protein
MNQLEDKNQIVQAQMNNFDMTLKSISDKYFLLVGKRVYDKDFSRSEYMIYDMMDMIIHLDALLSQVDSGFKYPDYCIEKLNSMKSYIDTTLAYFNSINK